MSIPNQKSLFAIPDDIVFMNCAYMSPHLKRVSEAGIAAIEHRSKPWTFQTADWFEPAKELKQLFASIINCHQQHIALIPSASYGIAVAKNNIRLEASQEIVLLDQEYPSNYYAWQELSKETGASIITVTKEDDQNWTDAILDKINSRTGLVAISNCHWANGGLVDLVAVSKKVRAIGAKLVIDASQSLGVYPLDVQDVKPDFLISVGYKWLLGAYGLSYLYTDEKYFKEGRPIEYTWIGRKDSDDFTRLVAYTDEFRPGADRFDAGEYPAFINIPIAKAALTQILEWGVENIQSALSALTAGIADLADARGIAIADRNHAGHIIGLKLDGEKAEKLKTTLPANKIYTSFRGSILRIAPHLYNDEHDVEQLFRFL